MLNKYEMMRNIFRYLLTSTDGKCSLPPALAAGQLDPLPARPRQPALLTPEAGHLAGVLQGDQTAQGLLRPPAVPGL